MRLPKDAAWWPWGTDAPSRRVPWATVAYLTGTVGLLLVYAVRYGVDASRVPASTIDFWAYRVPELAHDPVAALGHAVLSVWANYYLLQFLYVTALLLVFAPWFERHEGPLRTAVVFYAGSIAAGLVAGGILLALDRASDAAWIDGELARVWVGGSAGMYAVVGGVAARARHWWPWLLGAVLWEAVLGFAYLRSSTPLFHYTALATGFLLVRFAFPPSVRTDG